MEFPIVVNKSVLSGLRLKAQEHGYELDLKDGQTINVEVDYEMNPLGYPKIIEMDYAGLEIDKYYVGQDQIKEITDQIHQHLWENQQELNANSIAPDFFSDRRYLTEHDHLV